MNQIKKLAPNGTLSLIAGEGYSGCIDGPGARARFHYPGTNGF
jgi:hypothetical protein